MSSFSSLTLEKNEQNSHSSEKIFRKGKPSVRQTKIEKNCNLLESRTTGSNNATHTTRSFNARGTYRRDTTNTPSLNYGTRTGTPDTAQQLLQHHIAATNRIRKKSTGTTHQLSLLRRMTMSPPSSKSTQILRFRLLMCCWTQPDLPPVPVFFVRSCRPRLRLIYSSLRLRSREFPLRRKSP